LIADSEIPAERGARGLLGEERIGAAFDHAVVDDLSMNDAAETVRLLEQRVLGQSGAAQQFGAVRGRKSRAAAPDDGDALHFDPEMHRGDAETRRK
jgi:hypothetical protein